jgi:hypothetical protein
MTDAWRSMRMRDSLWNPPLRMLRLSGDLPFLQWTKPPPTRSSDALLALRMS